MIRQNINRPTVRCLHVRLVSMIWQAIIALTVNFSTNQNDDT